MKDFSPQVRVRQYRAFSCVWFLLQLDPTQPPRLRWTVLGAYWRRERAEEAAEARREFLRRARQ